MEKGSLFHIQPFSLHDGPGVRTTVFLKGCGLRCWWCQNVESWRTGPELMFHANLCIGCGACVRACPHASEGLSARFTDRCVQCGRCAAICYAEALEMSGFSLTAEELLARLLPEKELFDASGGGVTFSGGEPLMQEAFLAEALRLLRAKGVHTAIETALFVPPETVRRIAPLADLFLADLKCVDEARHRHATGQSNLGILENLRWLAASGVPLRVRIPIIPTFNDNSEELHRIGGWLAALDVSPMAELLPFNSLCAGKYESLSRPYPGAGLKTPSPEDMARYAALVRSHGVNVQPTEWEERQ